jgi:hypothetical protein
VVRSVQAWSIGRKELQLCAWDVGSSSAVLKQRLNCAHAVRCITQADDLLYLGGGTSISIVNLRGEVRLREATPTGAAMWCEPHWCRPNDSHRPVAVAFAQRVQPMLQFHSNLRALCPCPWYAPVLHVEPLLLPCPLALRRHVHPVGSVPSDPIL